MMSQNDMVIQLKDNNQPTDNVFIETRYRSLKTQYEVIKEISLMSKKKSSFSIPQLIVLGIIGGSM